MFYLTVLQPVVCFLIVQEFFLINRDHALTDWVNLLPLVLASANILVFIVYGIILPKIYLTKVAFVDNPLASTPSIYPLVRLVRRVLFQLAFLGAATN